MKILKIILIDGEPYYMNAEKLIYMMHRQEEGITRLRLDGEIVLKTKETPESITTRLGLTVR